MEPIPDPLLPRESGSAGNGTRDLRIYIEELSLRNALSHEWFGLTVSVGSAKQITAL
jgi:hypothetical protein